MIIFLNKHDKIFEDKVLLHWMTFFVVKSMIIAFFLLRKNLINQDIC